MRTERYRYVDWTVPESEFVERELYDYEADADETANVVDRPEYVEAVRELSALLKRQ